MKISTKGRYGLKALVDLAMYDNSEIVTLKSISDRQNISEGYLEQIFSILRKSGLVIGKKGAQGGYLLSRHVKQIRVGEILRALEGDLVLVDINDADAMDDIEKFINEKLWNIVNERINNFFDSITLEDLVNQYKRGVDNLMYFI